MCTLACILTLSSLMYVYLFCISELIFKEVRKKYKQWIEDSHSLEICLQDSAITLDLQERKVDPWKIVPLAEPQVKI